MRVYQTRCALARERIVVARMFIPRTNTSKTRAVPYCILTGIFGTWVEITKRWYGSAMVASKGDLGRSGKKKAAAVKSIGAVSPAARSKPRITPVRIPGTA
jgi:hypothetical protein